MAGIDMFCIEEDGHAHLHIANFSRKPIGYNTKTIISMKC